MLEIAVIGIGTGNPEHMTVEAIRVLNSADLVLIPLKGADKGDLAALRRDICARYLTNPATRLVEFDMPVRDSGARYLEGVEDWHGQIADAYRRLLVDETGTAAILVWGDPSLYDSTLRILDLLASTGLTSTRRVVPGITSLQLLAARHGIPLHAIGEPLEVTTGRRLREALPEAGSIAVMLDSGGAFDAVPAEDFDIFWGAYLGLAEEITIAGPLAEAGPRIKAARQAARRRNGWIMDIYLLRRR